MDTIDDDRRDILRRCDKHDGLDVGLLDSGEATTVEAARPLHEAGLIDVHPSNRLPTRVTLADGALKTKAREVSKGDLVYQHPGGYVGVGKVEVHERPTKDMVTLYDDEGSTIEKMAETSRIKCIPGEE